MAPVAKAQRPVSIGQGPYRPSTEDPADIFVRVAERMEVSATRVETLLTEVHAAGAQIGANKIMAEVSRASIILVARQNKRLIWTVAGAALFLSVALSLGMVFWFQPECVSQAGGRYCYVWVVEPRGK